MSQVGDELYKKYREQFPVHSLSSEFNDFLEGEIKKALEWLNGQGLDRSIGSDGSTIKLSVAGFNSLVERMDLDVKLKEVITKLAYNEVLKRERDELLKACQAVYKKHVCDDDSIGWGELGDILHDAIRFAMGAEEYCKWSDSLEDKDKE